LVGADAYPAEFNARLDSMQRPGSTMKVNLALRDLPTFTCLPERRNQHGATMHILPDESVVWQSLKDQYEQVKAGRLADFPTIEWYVHTPVDPSMTDEKGRHSSALFVQWVPYEIEGSTWEAEATRYAEHLVSICDRFAPDTSSLIDDMFVLTPKDVESHFGITWGHIHHIDNQYGFDERHPYATPAENIYSCSAGCHPAGSVIGASGHNAAERILKDLGVTK
jgi:phytoene dehydrogenase-like protein